MVFIDQFLYKQDNNGAYESPLFSMIYHYNTKVDELADESWVPELRGNLKRNVIEYVNEDKDTINVLLEWILPGIDLINDRITINKMPVSFGNYMRGIRSIPRIPP